jgi:hypothetical protein
MKADELTKTEVEEMSDVEVVYWFKQFAEQEQAAQMRKHMLTQIEIRDAEDGPHILPLHVDSTVVG